MTGSARWRLGALVAGGLALAGLLAGACRDEHSGRGGPAGSPTAERGPRYPGGPAHYTGRGDEPACCTGPDIPVDPDRRLHDLDAKATPIHARFLKDRSRVRVVLVLSPTEPQSLRLARRVVMEVLSRTESIAVRVFAVWTPLIARDDRPSARVATAILGDVRVRHFWDERGQLREGGEPPIVRVYAPEADWGAARPAPLNAAAILMLVKAADAAATTPPRPPAPR